MQRILLQIILVFAAAAPSVFAINYHAYTSGVECEGESFYCSDDGNTCCGYPANFGYSANFENLPQHAYAEGFKDGTCNEGNLSDNVLFSLHGSWAGPKTKCWNGGGFHRATNLMWHPSSFTKRLSNSVNANQECYSPSGFRYQDQNGVCRDIKLERGVDMSEAEKVAELYKAGNFDALAQYLDN